MNVRLEHVGTVVLRSIEADLDVGDGLTYLFDRSDQTVAQAICHPDEEILQGADGGLERPGQAPVQEQLDHVVSDLQQEVVVLAGVLVLAEDVLQFVPMTFLFFESLILNLPSCSASLIGHTRNGRTVDFQIGYPCEVLSLLSGIIGQAVEGGEMVPFVLKVVNPAQVLIAIVNIPFQYVFGCKIFQPAKLIPRGRQTSLLECNDPVPLKIIAEGEGVFVGVKSIQQKHNRQSGKQSLHLLRESDNRLQFAILPTCRRIGVLNELACRR